MSRFVELDEIASTENLIHRIKAGDDSAFTRLVNISYALVVTADLNSSHRFSKKVEALLNLRNLTDYYRNDVNPGFPVMGRQIEMGMRIRP